jgi:hypothetical protein
LLLLFLGKEVDDFDEIEEHFKQDKEHESQYVKSPVFQFFEYVGHCSPCLDRLCEQPQYNQKKARLAITPKTGKQTG